MAEIEDRVGLLAQLADSGTVRPQERELELVLFGGASGQLPEPLDERIFTSDSRLLERIVRDRLFRNYRAERTIEMWPSVRRGETRNIFPFQEQSDAY